MSFKIRRRSIIKTGLFLTIYITFSGCSVTNMLQPDAANVQISENMPNSVECTYLGEVIGAEGKLYNYLFISNYDLTEGARNDLRNKAHALGGNVVQIETRSSYYSTSTVYVGNVYRCPDIKYTETPHL
ncbi:MAG: DUF4156 domain-containing protein [Helicobacteraceae bacterium]|jgi:hypothetical protein|nr:DUF4156 domain-containing protein [Helicobacteraceae bacterium]